MRYSSIEAVFDSLNREGVSFLVVGGLAVNAHGYGRATFDIDLVIDLERDNVTALFHALARLGFRPLVPVDESEFGDPIVRRRLSKEKGMVVLPFHSDEHRETSLDVFAEMPFDFDKEREKAMVEEIGPGIPVPIVALETLLEMKQGVGRPKDLDDVENLSRLTEEDDAHDS